MIFPLISQKQLATLGTHGQTLLSGKHAQKVSAQLMWNSKYCSFSIFSKTAKYCPVPPTIEQGGTVFANSTGNKYGAVCLGNDEVDPVPTACPLVTVQHEKVEQDPITAAGLSRYKLWVETDTNRADTVYFQIKFDAPVIDIQVNEHRLDRYLLKLS